MLWNHVSEISFLVTPLQRPEVSACNLMCAQNKLRFSKRFLVITFIAYRGVFLVMLVYVFPSPALCHKGNGCRKLAHYFKVALCILSNLGLLLLVMLLQLVHLYHVFIPRPLLPSASALCFRSAHPQLYLSPPIYLSLQFYPRPSSSRTWLLSLPRASYTSWKSNVHLRNCAETRSTSAALQGPRRYSCAWFCRHVSGLDQAGRVRSRRKIILQGRVRFDVFQLS